jgi:hypothetical protein
MQRSRTRYAPPRSLAAPAGPAQATSACLQPARADGIAQQVEKETGGSSIDEVDEAKGRVGQFDITLDQDCKPLGMTHRAVGPPWTATA